jgi:PelA/Pel-15E family pectate lyase
MIKFLMRKGPTTPDVTTLIEQGITWIKTNRLTGLCKIRTPEGKTDYITDPTSTEVYWARFYDVVTGQPLFAGAQDGIIYPTFQEMAKNNKVAYGYFTSKPNDIIAKEVERWHKRLVE